jgi:hypothetical protein
MRTAGLLALGLLVAAPTFAQDGSEDATIGGRHAVAEGNTWSIDDDNCTIDAGWGGDVGVIVNRHLDHHDLGISDLAFRKVLPGKVVTVSYGAAGKAAGKGDYEALGYRDSQQKTYVIEADDVLLDDFARTGSLQFSRAGVMELDLDMVGFPAALAAMHACEASEQANMAEAMPADESSGSADDATVNAEAAAAAAAEGAAKP